MKIANETIEMDYYNKKFNIKENICNNSTCKFKLELDLKNKNGINSKYKYNILFKDNFSHISIPAFETIYGVLKNDNKENKYSINNIGKYYNYELECNFCEFKEENHNGDKIIFSIKLKEEKEINFDVYYNFRINFYDNENVILYHLNSVRNHHYCELNKTKPCYYLVHIEQYNAINNLQFLVQNIQNVTIFLKSIKKGESEKDIYQKIVDNKINFNFKEPRNYLNIKNDYKGCKILLKITSNNEINTKVNLVYDIFKRNYSSTKNIYKDDFCLINTYKNNYLNIELINTKDEYYILDINLLNGTEIIDIKKNENSANKIYYLQKDFKDNFNFFSSLNENYSIQFRSAPGADSIIYYRKIKSKNKSIIKEINFGKSNYLTYEKQEEIPYQSFYINLKDAEIKDEDIHLNYKYLEILKQHYPDDLSLELLMVNEDYIIQEKEGLNNDNSFYDNLNNITYYQKYMGAGYSLLNKSSIVDNKNYLYIKLNNKPREGFDFVITLTDFSENINMPINIYLFIFIKVEKKIKLSSENITKSFIEIANDNNLSVNCINCDDSKKTKDGKTFYTGDEFIELHFKNNKESGKMPNLLIKQGFLYNEPGLYFSLSNDSINYFYSNKSISFHSLVTSKNLENSNYSVIYNILIYDKDIGINNILIKTKPIASKIYNWEKSSTLIIHNNINDTLIGKYGTLYINILAEAKIKDVENKTYEYLLYKTTCIKTETNITISQKENMITFNRAENVKITANISIDDKDITQYKFIKLILITHNEEDKRKKFEIYASNDSSFLNTQEGENLYEKSEFKSVDSYNNTILTIPVESCKTHQLYIQIPCREVKDFQLIYRIEDGRKMEGITIHENTCFDIFLKNTKSDNLNYRFVYIISKEYYPLITFTTYEINNEYELLSTGFQNNYLKKFFYNGHAFIFKYTEDYFEYHTFILRLNVTTVFRVCHRIVEKNEEKIETFTPISIGENIYSALRNEMDLSKDCFKIEKNEGNEYKQYMFNYISKSQNMKLKIIGNNNETFSLFHESGNIPLNPNVDNFCLCLREEAEDNETYYDFHGSINFQIFGIKESLEFQNNDFILMPLINGYFVKQTLQPGQMIYYRSYKYKINSRYLKMHLQRLKGDIIIEKTHFENYPEFKFQESKAINDAFYPNNYYDEEELKENEYEVYNKANFIVYIVKCKNSGDNDENCTYYIGLHNEESSLSLNENRKIYFSSKKRKKLYFSTEFYSETYIEKKGEEEERDISKKYYLEIHLLEGKLNISKVFINGSNTLHNFDNKTYYYSSQPYDYITDIGFYSFPCQLDFDEDILFYISYRILIYKKNGARKTDYFYNIYEEEMHYNILTPYREIFYYNYPDVLFENNAPTRTYIVSLFGINSFILVDDSFDYLKFNQFKLEKNVTEIICYIEGKGYADKQCEFIFSFAELKENSIFKKVEFDGFEQSYELDNDIKNICLYFNLTEEELKKDYILIIINKVNLYSLKIEYDLKNVYIPEDFTNLLHSYDTKKMNDIFRIDLKQLKNESEIQSGKDINRYLMIRLTSETSNKFRIKINIKNNPIYLSMERIEFGSVKLNEPLYYYFDYETEEPAGTPRDFEEIYLYNKGNVKMMVSALEYSEKFPYNPNDIYKNIYDDKIYNYTTDDSGNNHIKITNKDKKDYNLGLKIYIKVYLEANENVNDNNYYNSFSICRHTKNLKNLFVKLNTNMFGNIYINESEEYSYEIFDITKITGSLIINIDCLSCSLNFLNYNEKDIKLTNSYIFNRENSLLNYNEDNIEFYITGEKGYYFFSFFIFLVFQIPIHQDISKNQNPSYV